MKDTKVNFKKSYQKLMFFTGVGDYDKIDLLVHEKRSAFSNEVFLACRWKWKRYITGSSYHAYVKTKWRM